MLDLSQSSFRMVYPALCAHFGLRIQGACGPKFWRDNLLAVMEDLRERGQDISVNTRRRVVRIGDHEYPMNGSRSGEERPRPTGNGAAGRMYRRGGLE